MNRFRPLAALAAAWLGAALLAAAPALAQTPPAAAAWQAVLDQARGQTVYWNAWAGDDKTNDFIAWAGAQLKARYGVTVQHVRLKDTAEAVTRVIAEKSAGRDQDGSVDLVWINGPNFLNLKQRGLLYGPVTPQLPNFRYVDTLAKRSNVVDFTTPVDGYAVPWLMAKLVFMHDSARLPVAELPRSAAELLDWARRHPGRLTHPQVGNFLGVTFLKQMLIDLLPDAAVLQRPASDDNFAATTAPLWAWYDALRPLLWRRGERFPDNGAAQRQLLSDGEIDISLSFNPTEAASAIESGLLPATVRPFVLRKGTLGNTSFVAIPYNASHRAGAMVLANFLLEPATQARAQDLRGLGQLNVLDLARLPAAERARFEPAAPNPALLGASELGATQLEPHASWMTRITAQWQRRYTR